MTRESPLGMHCFVSGRVQGVGFRWHTRREAQRLGLAGWVRNLPDGRVELQAFGAGEAIDALVEYLGNGPGLAEVSGLEQRNIPYAPCDGFAVLDTPA